MPSLKPTAQYLVSQLNGSVGEYNATTGAAINANFATGLTGPPFALAVPAVPEPSWWMMAGGGAALLGILLRKKHRIA